ncbi:hypothetical protein XACJK48_6290004 [Xanthomonas citri pv. citri]|nr:hypothetical protein XAC3824_790005 [Xanthomonas citri pv. citri]CEE46071.1 hypothetical protein XAC902_860005 [Xanthomonas citri pv. citri]CEE46824.1 hypothetical protein XAC2911_670005 [Xanthomonas citri pv. citri]CEE50847.1 hypothetical protein XACS584_1040005 [Xanthomonas citri pv. citri]CEE67834.1 hypothetical protein XACLE20_1280005 [Xanthomonas citri pv. citri]
MSKPRRVPAAMKIAILSRNSKLYSTRRLIEAGRKRGHTVRILDPLRCYMRIAADGFSLHYKGKPITGFDAVIPRIGASVTRYGTAVLRQLEFMGTSTRPTRRTPSCARATNCARISCWPRRASTCRSPCSATTPTTPRTCSPCSARRRMW